jgi:hypothetical protein
MQNIQAMQKLMGPDPEMQRQLRLQELGRAYLMGDQNAGMQLMAEAPEYATQVQQAASFGQPKPQEEPREIQLARSLGLQPGTAEFDKFVREMVMKNGGVTVNVGGQGAPGQGPAYDPGKLAEGMSGLAVKRAEQYALEAEKATEQAAINDEAASLIVSGKVDLGAGADFMTEMKRIANLAGAEFDVSAQERFGMIQSRLTQLQKQPGSGSTSDKDMVFFERATVNVGKSGKGNLMGIIADRASQQDKIFRQRAYDSWLYEGRNPGEFQQYWDKSKPDIRETAAEIAIRYGLDPTEYVPGYRQGGKGATPAATPAPRASALDTSQPYIDPKTGKLVTPK